MLRKAAILHQYSGLARFDDLLAASGAPPLQIDSPACIKAKALVDVRQRELVGDQIVNVDLLFQVPVDAFGTSVRLLRRQRWFPSTCGQ
jgi:hypothetical protein